LIIGNLRFAREALDELLAAARHDDVDEPGHGDELAHRGAVGGLYHLHRGLGQARAFQARAHALGDRQVGAQRLGAAAQDAGVARLQAQSRGVGRHVRARFVDDADHAERHAHAADLDAGRAAREPADFSDRVFQRRDLFQSFGHLRDALRIEREAIDEGAVAAGFFRLLHIGLIGLQQLRRARADRVRHRAQRAVLGIAAGTRELARGFARRAPEFAHVGRDIRGFATQLRARLGFHPAILTPA
jgi:hypothetical protein